MENGSFNVTFGSDWFRIEKLACAETDLLLGTRCLYVTILRFWDNYATVLKKYTFYKGIVLMPPNTI